MRVEDRVALLLPAVGVELLAEVALPVHQADADERDAEAAGRLQVVAGQHAETARVLGQGLGDAELGREVGHAAQRRWRPGSGTTGAPRGSGAGRRAISPRKPMKAGSAASCSSRWRPTRPSRRTGSWKRQLPDLGVDPAEQVAGPVVPGPAQVERQLLERGQRLGQAGSDREAAECLHRANVHAGAADRQPLGLTGRPTRSPRCRPRALRTVG